MKPWMEQLNDAQRQAVLHDGGPMLVIAGAGTGKTKTLAARVAHLIDSGVEPDRILLLTFTRRAAAEMLSRVGDLVGREKSSRVWGGTFHSTASRLLRTFGRAVGVDPAFNVIDSDDSADLLDLVRADLGLGSGEKRFPRKSTLAAIYSRIVNTRRPLSETVAAHFPWVGDHVESIGQLFDAFTRRKRQQRLLDYDDLLLYWHAMLQTNPVGTEIEDRFEHVLVDEYQDTNFIQADILKSLRRRNKNVMVVGDDAQAIYAFRAATVENILQFPDAFESTTVVKLEQNYRSVQPILDASNRLMSRASHQFAKNLFSTRTSRQKPRIVTVQDEAEQCRRVCDAVLGRVEEGVNLHQQAVLFRTGHHSDALEIELSRRNIPFIKYGGLRFVETAHVKDMVALLRLVVNVADEISWLRVLQLFDGVGPAAARKFVRELLADGVERAASTLRDKPPAVPAAGKENFIKLRRLVLDAIEKPSTPATLVESAREFLSPIFEKTYDNPELRLRDIDQLEQIAAGYTSLNTFLSELALDPPTSAQDLAGVPTLDDDHLILSTIHSAKGCEWDVVHLVHCTDGNIPSDLTTGSEAELAEERRLLYVAMTRAREELNIYCPLRYYFRKNGCSDRHSYAQVSRFIPVDDLELYERVGSARGGETIEPNVPGLVEQQVDAVLSQLWK